MLNLDLSFLTVTVPPAPAPHRAVNVYDILREGWRESRVDMTLQFFLDPNERHGLGSTVIDALLRALDGVPLLGKTGHTGDVFSAEEYSGSSAWEIGTQVDFIDVYALNSDLDLAIVLENKIGHELNNPLDRYAARALEDASSVIVAVLAPQHRAPLGGQEQWLSRSISYDQFNEEIKRAPELLDCLLAPIDLNQHRSLELLQQFMEARCEDLEMNNLANESARLEEWRGLIKKHEDSINRFMETRTGMRRLIRERNNRFKPLIAERFAEIGYETGWEAHSGGNDDFWNAYHFPEIDWSIELKLSTKPDLPMIYVMHYPERDYKKKHIEDLGVPWSATDDEIVNAFIERVQTIFAEVRSNVSDPPT